MKKHLFMITLITIAPNSEPMVKNNPGCIRQNSDEIRRDLMFMHIKDGHWELLYSLLDAETIYFTDQSGKTIIEKLNEYAQKNRIEVSLALKYIENLKANS